MSYAHRYNEVRELLSTLYDKKFAQFQEYHNYLSLLEVSNKLTQEKEETARQVLRACEMYFAELERLLTEVIKMKQE